MGIPDHLTCFLRNLYVGQKATVRNEHGTTDRFQIGKGVCQDYILSPCLFNLYTDYISEMPRWMKHKLESRFLGEISINSDMQMTAHLCQKAKRLFSSSLSPISMMSSVYLRLFIFLLTIFIPACASSSPVFLMMYSVYK